MARNNFAAAWKEMSLQDTPCSELVVLKNRCEKWKKDLQSIISPRGRMNRFQNYSTQKPENVLKRVNELIASATGNNADKEKQFALEQLHNIIAGSRKKQWHKVYESLMKRHVELCVDLKDHRYAKDGLHQYRNLCQNVDPNSLENVILHLIDLAEARATQARDKANKVALAAAAKISDLDQEETPESIMLSTMTEEGAKDRTDREVVVPWLKFLWETYRAILELLHKNAKLERVYAKTCEKAFKFCQDYHRTLEFRRLCEMLRTQLVNLQRQPTSALRATKAWDWSPETIELHLQIRFLQLEVATNLEQWNEGFRTVEDIYNIIQISKKMPKAKVMVAYYEKLTRIFWVSENHLFHAHAWFRYYTLFCETKREIRVEDRQLIASNVLLAALCIPREDEDDTTKEKNQRLAMMLDFQANPSRQDLLADIQERGVLNDVLPELSNLFSVLDEKFHPLQLVAEVAPILNAIAEHSTLKMYLPALRRVAVLHTTQQLAKVYQTVRISFVQELFAPLNMKYCDIEKYLVSCIVKKQLQMQVDHQKSQYKFGAQVTADTVVEGQLAKLGTQLNQINNIINSTPKTQEEKKQQREKYLASVLAASAAQAAHILDRKNVIERRKEGLEKLQQQRNMEETKRKELEESRRREEENARLRKEEEMRNQAKMSKIRDQLQVSKTKKVMEALGKSVDESTLVDLDEKARKDLINQAQQEVQRAKEEANRKQMEQAKKLDYITRAKRHMAAERIAAKYAEDVEEDRKEYERRCAIILAKAKEAHESALEDKKRLGRITKYRGGFEKLEIEEQKIKFAASLQTMKEEAKRKHIDRKVIRARQRKEAEEERIEMERELERERIEREAADAAMAEQVELLRIQRQKEEQQEEAEWRRGQAEDVRPSHEDSTWRRERPAEDVRPGREEPSWRRGAASAAPTREFERGAPREFERGAPREFERGAPREFERGAPREFERGAPREFERGAPREFERGAPREFERGAPRDFERGAPRGDDTWTRVPNRGRDARDEKEFRRGDAPKPRDEGTWRRNK